MVAFVVTTQLNPVSGVTAWTPPDVARRLAMTAALKGAWIEELIKAAALLGLFLWQRNEFDNTVDGIIYATMVGLGLRDDGERAEVRGRVGGRQSRQRHVRAGQGAQAHSRPPGAVRVRRTAAADAKREKAHLRAIRENRVPRARLAVTGRSVG